MSFYQLTKFNRHSWLIVESHWLYQPRLNRVANISVGIRLAANRSAGIRLAANRSAGIRSATNTSLLVSDHQLSEEQLTDQSVSSKVRIVTEAPESKPPSRCQSSSETSSAQPSSSATYTASSHRSGSCSNYRGSVEVWSFRDWEWKSSSGLATKRQVLGTRESLHSFSESSRSASKAVATLTGETSPGPSISQPGPSWP